MRGMILMTNLKITEKRLKRLSDEDFVEALRLMIREWWRRTILVSREQG